MTHNYDSHDFDRLSIAPLLAPSSSPPPSPPSSPSSHWSINHFLAHRTLTSAWFFNRCVLGMPRTSVKQRLVKWFLATLDAEIEGYQKLTLASYLDGELAMLVAVTISASSPLSINLDDLMIFSASKSHASSSLYSHLSTRFIIQSSHSRSLSL